MNYLIQALTYSRIALAPLIFLLVIFSEYFGWALFFFIIATISDFLDGYLARKYKLVSVMGAVLDPIADKILLVFMVFSISFAVQDAFVVFISSILLAREFWVSALRDYNSRNRNAHLTQVIFLAKLKTSVQFLAITLFLIALNLDNALILFIAKLVLFLSLILSVQSALQYTKETFK
jgi:CDP-diacylglycerol--glycerol-3-phosphate 3-phosphatidyltransferase